MKNITRIFIVCAALFACSSLFAGPATGKGHHHKGKGYHQSGVIGQVYLGSKPSPVPVDVLVTSGGGRYVTDFRTDADGSFDVDLKPGRYVLVAYFVTYFIVGPPSEPPAPDLIFGTPVTVTVEKKQFAAVVLTIPLEAMPALFTSPQPH